MAITLNEPIITAVRELLDAGLAAKVAEINAEVSDGIEIAAPLSERVLDFIPSVALLTDFPAIGIGDGPTRFEDDIGSSATGRHEFIVAVYEQDADQRALAWKLRRHAQAVTRVLAADQTLGGSAWGSGFSRVDPGPTLADDPEAPREFMSWVGISFWAKKEEE